MSLLEHPHGEAKLLHPAAPRGFAAIFLLPRTMASLRCSSHFLPCFLLQNNMDLGKVGQEKGLDVPVPPIPGCSLGTQRAQHPPAARASS